MKRYEFLYQNILCENDIIAVMRIFCETIESTYKENIIKLESLEL